MLRTSLKFTITAIAATFVACATSACSSSDSSSSGDAGGGGLPDFNSIDTTVQCPAGQIGWNYTTGGGTLDTSQGSALTGVQVLSASYGANCNANLANNEEAIAVTACNGQTECMLKVGLTYDPAVNCAKEFDTTWQCGSDSTVYSGTIAKEAGNQTFTYDCGPKILMQSAYTKTTCNGITAAPVNAGDGIAPPCNFRSQCNYAIADFNQSGCTETFTANWTCGSNPAIQTSTVNVTNSAARGATTPFNILCSGAPTVNVQSATWGENCSGVPQGNLTSKVAAACDGNATGSCAYTVGGIPDPHYGCAKNFEVKYLCGNNPFLYDATYPAEAGGQTYYLRCAGSTPFSAGNTSVDTGQKACIAQNCPWNQPRDPNTEQCGPVNQAELNLLSVSLRSYNFTDVATGHSLNPSVFNSGPTTILSNWPTNLNVELMIPDAFYQTHVTLEPWMTYLFNNKNGGQAEGFLCGLSPLDVPVGTVSPFNPVYQLSTGNKVLPASCFDARSNPYADAAARMGLTEAQFRQNYTYATTLMHFSFDTEGKIGLGQASLPNPPGFYYNQKTNYTDYISFYQQRELTSIQYGPNDTPWSSLKWSQSPPTEDSQAYNLQTSTMLEVNLDGSELRKGAATDLDYFALSGPQIGVDVNWSLVGDSPINPLSPTTTNPQSSVKNLAQANLRATVEIFPAGQSSNSTYVVGSIPLQGGVPTGGTTSGTLTFPTGLDTQLFGAWNGYNTFSLKTCIDLDGVNTRNASAGIPDTSVFSGKINNNNCVIQNSVMTINRTFIKHTIRSQQTANGVSNMDNSSKGDAKNSSSDGSGSEKSCVKGSANGHPTFTCSAAQSSTNTSGGAFASSLYSVNANSATTHTSNTTAGQTANSGTSSGTAEVLGFQVLDQDDGPQNGWQSGSGVDTTEEIFISPNWDAIADAYNDMPEEPKPMADEGLYGGHLGLGFGFGYKQFLGGFGVIDINFAIGVSIGLDFKWTNNPAEAYPCIGAQGTFCDQVTANVYTQSDAAKQCEVEGGQLANLISTQQYQAAVNALAGFQPQYNIWTGGQTNYEFPNAACANQTTPSASCINSGKTHADWSDPNSTEFGVAQGTSNSFAYNVTNTSGVSPIGNLALTNLTPTPAGMSLNHAGQLHTQPQSQLNYALCQFDAAPSTSYSEFDLSVPVGAGAGLSLQFCWPSDEVGVCLLGTLQFIGIQLAPTVSTYSTTLYDSGGNPFGFRGDTNVGIPWQVTLLSGEIDLIAQFLFWSTSYKLYQYPGFILAQGNLASYDWPSQENF